MVTYLKTDQCLVCGVFNPATNITFTLAFFYARNRDAQRRPLWELLVQLSSMSLIEQSPWLVLGDFNQVLSSNEMFSIYPFVVSRIGMIEFQDCIKSSRLADIVRRGCYFTWTNRQPLNPIARKLDRALSNEAWVEAFPSSTALFDNLGASDHSPCLVSVSGTAIGRKTPFKFVSFFTTHPEFQSLIKDCWEDVLPLDSLMTILCKRLRATKLCYKNLNRSSFSNVQLRGKEAFENLVTIQGQLHSAPSQRLFEEERQA